MLIRRMAPSAAAVHSWMRQSIAHATIGSRRMHNLKISPEVKNALRTGKPLVALESTIISHGMPFPQNYTMATEVEALVREHGACPATIAILDGEVCVGLSDEQLQTLASAGSRATKCSTRDIPAVVAKKGIGATTVSSTMRIAHAAGIQVFVTGGIGGVHRFCEETMDISTDLMELSRTPVAVICAGVKSILDIPRTLEYLETQAVPVVGYKTKDFPAFFTQSSGSPAHLELNSAEECAKLIQTSQDLDLPNGFLIALFLKVSTNANLNIFLAMLLLHTCSSEVNSRLVGAQIALALKGNAPKTTKADVVVVGGVVLDVISKPTSQYVRGTSNIGQTQQTWGGVGRNVAECLHRLDIPTVLVSNVGQDSSGQGLIIQLNQLGMDTSGISVIENKATATYCAMLNPSGDMDVAIADMRIFDSMQWDHDDLIAKVQAARVLILDGNLSASKMSEVTAIKPSQLTWFEPTSIEKAIRPIEGQCLHHLNVISPNQDELHAMCNLLRQSSTKYSKIKLPADISTRVPLPNVQELIDDIALAFHSMRADNPSKTVHVLVTLGKNGLLIGTSESHDRNMGPDAVCIGVFDQVSYVYLPGVPMNSSNCTGAGDSLVGGTVYGLLQNKDIVTSAKLGMIAARKSIGSALPIHPQLSTLDLA
ncbi:hypothetical protein Ae201684P_001114 [Aphanomyces euteiches]|nr:hypothetical protein Ae201684P_001114 [Aphanomyces euteiches]